MRERLEPLLTVARDVAQRARVVLARADAALERALRRVVADLRRRWRARRARDTRTTPAHGGDAPRAAHQDTYATVVAERDDDIASITGRIDTAADANVVLLVPKAARGMREAAIWPHVTAHARRRGIALAVVSGRGDVRGHAGANGLTTARSLSALDRRRRRLRVGDRELTLPSIPWRGLTTAVILGGAVFSVVTAACYTIPSAEIVIVPPSSEFTTSMRARLSPLATAADIETGLLPARNLRVITTVTLSVETSGEAQVPDAAAIVTLEFTNESDEDVSVPQGTRVFDEQGIAFTTDADVAVPAGASAPVAATAVEPGLAGNVDAETVRSVDGFAGTLSVLNPAAASGGTTRAGPGVGEGDLSRVREIADEALTLVGARALEREVEDGRYFPQTQSIAILSETPFANVGEPAEYLLVEYQLVVTALALTGDDLAASAPEIVRNRLAPGMALLPGTATASADSPAELDDGSVVLTVQARGQVAPIFSAEAMGEAVTGQTPATAAARLTEMLDLVEPPRITIEPSVVPWQWLPRRANRISFLYAAPGTLTDEDRDEDEDTDEDEDSDADEQSDAPGTPTTEPTPTGTGAPLAAVERTH